MLHKLMDRGHEMMHKAKNEDTIRFDPFLSWRLLENNDVSRKTSVLSMLQEISARTFLHGFGCMQLRSYYI